jgi:short-subunit dehydrogenase
LISQLQLFYKKTPMNPRRIKGQSVVITGAASGIGEALALAFAARGAHLLLADINAAGLERVAAAARLAGATCHVRVVDTGSEEAVFELASHALQTMGGTDFLINNAGVGLVAPVQSMQSGDAQWLMNINFWGVVHGCRAFLPQLRERPDAVVVNMSSIFAMVSLPTQSMYNASKAAVRAFSDSLRLELSGTSVDVLCVHPGGIKTEIANNSRVGDVSMIANTPEEMRKTFSRLALTTPEQTALKIVQAIENRRTRLLVGHDAMVMDWMSRLFPARASRWSNAFGQWLRARAQLRSERRRKNAPRP